MLRAIIRLADARRTEGVGRNDIRSGVEVSAGNRLDDVGPRHRENVVIALLIVRQAQIARIIGLGELIVLNLRAPGSISKKDALGGFGEELVACGHDFALNPSKWQIA